MTAKRYGVLLTYDNIIQRGWGSDAGRYRRLKQAVKERDRKQEHAWFLVNKHWDLLGKGSFKYRWRVWDYVDKRFID